ncbi:MAG: Achromobacter phage Mano, partial [Planctomycetota bacterium]
KEPSEYLTPGELVARWKNQIGLGTLANWRSLGNGPKYLKLGGRILYPRTAVEAWEAENHREPQKAAR